MGLKLIGLNLFLLYLVHLYLHVHQTYQIFFHTLQLQSNRWNHMIKNVPTPLNNGYMPVCVCVYVCVKEREKEVKR